VLAHLKDSFILLKIKHQFFIQFILFSTVSVY